MDTDKRLSISLLTLRLTVFLVMFMWTLDKFLNPGHTAAIFKKFYMIGGLSEAIVYVIGAVQMVFVIGFVLGLYRNITYGVILALHAFSTFLSFRQYFDPFNNLLFFAAWPMLAAALTLFMMRDCDNYCTLDKSS